LSRPTTPGPTPQSVTATRPICAPSRTDTGGSERTGAHRRRREPGHRQLNSGTSDGDREPLDQGGAGRGVCPSRGRGYTSASWLWIRRTLERPPRTRPTSGSIRSQTSSAPTPRQPRPRPRRYLSVSDEGCFAIHLAGTPPDDVPAGNPTGRPDDASRPARKPWSVTSAQIPARAASGKQQRHRLNRRGEHQLNWALHVITLQQVHHHAQARAYYQRLLADGKTTK
jgi:hypothetical protein